MVDTKWERKSGETVTREVVAESMVMINTTSHDISKL